MPSTAARQGRRLAAAGLLAACAAQGWAQDLAHAEAPPANGMAYWQRAVMLQGAQGSQLPPVAQPRRQLGPVEMGFGWSVLRDPQRQAQPHGPLAADRGADTSSLGGPDPAQGELRMGLSFRHRGAHADLRQSLDMRMELSSSTALTVRPRGGRVTVQLSSRW